MGFRRVLIANRGEIALRILRTLRDMGIEVCIIHGREDRLSLPVRLADRAWPIYRSNPLDAYLDIEAVVEAAKAMEVDAVHPVVWVPRRECDLRAKVEEEDITFIGPRSDVISLLGDKIEARALMEAAGLPTCEGLYPNPSLRRLRPSLLQMRSDTLSSSRPPRAVAASACRSSMCQPSSRVL